MTENADLNRWDPLQDDYTNRRFNAYREGVGQDLQSRDVSDVGVVGRHKPVVLYVTNLPLDMDDIALQNVFEQEGKVLKVTIPTPSPEKVAVFHSKIGFVTMDNARGAQAAIENLNGFEVKGRKIIVRVKQSREEMVRRRDQKEREEEFFRSMGVRYDESAAGASNGAPESVGGFRGAGLSGDASSVSELSVTVKQDSRKVREMSGKGLLPAPGSRRPVHMSPESTSTISRLAPSQAPSVVPSMAGTDVGFDRCGYCEKNASLRCQACRKVYYCNINCQRSHWPLHRRYCTYDSKVTRVPATHQSGPQPDFANMDVDVDESYVVNNREYLTDWLQKSGMVVSSESESTTDSVILNQDYQKLQLPGPRNQLQPSSGPAKHRPEPVGERMGVLGAKGGQPPSTRHPQETNHRPADPYRRAGPQGMEGARPQGRFDRGPGGPGRDERSHGMNDRGPVRDGMNDRGPARDGMNDRGPVRDERSHGINGRGPVRDDRSHVMNDRGPVRDGMNDRGPNRDGSQSQREFASRAGSEFSQGSGQFQARRGAGCQDGSLLSRNTPQHEGRGGNFPRNGPANNQNDGGPQLRQGPPDEAKGFTPRNGPHEMKRGFQPRPDERERGDAGDRGFQQRNGPQQEENGFSPRKGPQPQKDRPNQFGGNGPPQEPRGFQPRNAPQDERGQRGFPSRKDDRSSHFGPRPSLPGGEKEGGPVGKGISPFQRDGDQNSQRGGFRGDQNNFRGDNQRGGGGRGDYQQGGGGRGGNQREGRGRGDYQQGGRRDYQQGGGRGDYQQGGRENNQRGGDKGENRGWGDNSQQDERGEQRSDGFGGGQNRGPQQGGPRRQEGNTRGGPFANNRPAQVDSASSRGGVRPDRQQGRPQDNRPNTTNNQRDGKQFGGLGSDADMPTRTAPFTSKSPTKAPTAAAGGVGGAGAGDASSELASMLASIPRELFNKPLQIVELNTPTTVVVSFVETPQRFWVHLAYQLKAFVPYLARFTNTYSGSQPATCAKAGQLFMCKYLGEMARARVVSVSGSAANIFYIDYGNSEDVQLSELHPVPKELSTLPPLALPCELKVRSKAADGQWSAEVRALWSGEFNMKNCIMTVLEKGAESCTVTLVNAENGKDGANFLKDEGLAVDPSEAPVLTVHPTPPRTMIGSMGQLMTELSVGQKVDVIVQEFANPLNIFVQLSDKEKAFDAFIAELNAVYENTPPQTYKPVVGEVVVGRFSEDKIWYRAEVVEVFPDISEASLFYLDYGNREQRPFTELRALKAKHAAVPIHGMLCGMQSFRERGEDFFKEEEELDIFLTCLKKYLREGGMTPACTVLVEEVSQGKVWVDIVSSDSATTLSQDLEIELGSVVSQAEVSQAEGAPSTPQIISSPKAESIPLAQSTPQAESMPLPQSTLQTQSTPQAEHKPQEEAAAPTTTRQLATGANKRVRAQQLSTVGIPMDCKLSVGIQVIQSCHRFFVNKKDAEGDIDQLRAQLVEMCDGGQSPPPPCEKVDVGDVVLVQFSEDDQWYRGSVESVADNGNTCTVFFLDYGNKEDKEVSTLREIPRALLALPAQAIMCALAAAPRPAPPELDRKFHSLCLLTECSVQVVSKEGECHIVDVFAANDENLSVLLGLEQPKAPTPPPVHEEEIPTQPPLSSQSPPLSLEAEAGNSAEISPAPPQLDDMAASMPSPPPLEETGNYQQAVAATNYEDTTAASAAAAVSSPQAAGGESVGEVLTRECLPVVAEDSAEMSQMIVTHVVSPAQFFAIHAEHYLLQNDDGGLTPLLQAVAQCPVPTHLPAVGQLMSGLFEGVWYRCEVLEVMGSQVRVVFFDYGNDALLGLSDLRPLPSQLCHNYPLATLQCCLHGVAPVSGDSWDEQSMAVTRELLENQRVRLLVTSVSQDSVVHEVTAHKLVIDESGAQAEEDVAQTLIQLKKAVAPSANPAAAAAAAAPPPPPPPPPPPQQAQQSGEDAEAIKRQIAQLQAQLAQAQLQAQLAATAQK